MPESGLAAALPLIDQLMATGKMPTRVGIVLKAEVIAAQVLIGRGQLNAAAVQLLRAAVGQIDVLVHCRVVKAPRRGAAAQGADRRHRDAQPPLKSGSGTVDRETVPDLISLLGFSARSTRAPTRSSVDRTARAR